MSTASDPLFFPSRPRTRQVKQAAPEAPLRFADLPDLMTVEDLARFAHASPNTLYALIETGALPVWRCGRRLLVPRVALQRHWERLGEISAELAAERAAQEAHS